MEKPNTSILIIVTHSNLDGANTHGDISPSFANKLIVEALAKNENVTIHNLTKAYPDYNIDVTKEQNLLLKHDTIVMLGPIYWYSLPAIAKMWVDEVLLYGWAYGSKGNALKEKDFYLALSSASEMKEYTTSDIGYTLEELFAPFQLTATYCKMRVHPILFLGGISSSNRIKDESALKSKVVRFTNELVTLICH